MQTTSFPANAVNLFLGTPADALTGSMTVLMKTTKTYTDGVTLLASGTQYVVTREWGKTAVDFGWAEDVNNVLPVTASPVVGAGGGVLGPFADLAALVAAESAESNSGMSAQVGSVAPYVIYDSNGSTWKPRLTASSANIRTRGLWKPVGSQSQVVQGQGDTVVRIMKREAEAPFSRVRLWIMNRNPNGNSQFKFAVAVTDELDVSTATNAFLPRRAGTTYNAPYSSTVQAGWVVGTWGGSLNSSAMNASTSAGLASVLSPILYPGSGFELPGYRPGIPTMATPDIQCSDWIRLRSIDPTTTPPNGIKRPLILLALGQVTAGAPVTGFLDGYNQGIFTAAGQNSSYTTWLAGATPETRLTVIAPSSGADAIGTGTLTLPTGYTPPPAWSGSATPTMLHFALEFDYDVPVRSFGFLGDSNTEGFNNFNNAVQSVSTPEKPYTFCNMGMSTNRWIEFESCTHQFLKMGAPFTDLLIPSASHNDIGTAVGNSQSFTPTGLFEARAEYSRQRERILRVLDICDELRIKPWLWTHFKGYDQAWPTFSPEPETVIHNNWIRELCASGRAQLVDITNIEAVPGAPNSYQVDNGVGRLLTDGTHPTTAGNIRAQAIFAAALQIEGGL